MNLINQLHHFNQLDAEANENPHDNGERFLDQAENILATLNEAVALCCEMNEALVLTNLYISELQAKHEKRLLKSGKFIGKEWNKTNDLLVIIRKNMGKFL